LDCFSDFFWGAFFFLPPPSPFDLLQRSCSFYPLSVAPFVVAGDDALTPNLLEFSCDRVLSQYSKSRRKVSSFLRASPPGSSLAVAKLFCAPLLFAFWHIFELRMTAFREVLHSRPGYCRESSIVVDFVLLSSFSLSQSGSSFSFSKCIPAFGDAAAVASKRNLCLLLRIHELEEFEESVELVLLLPLIQNTAAFLAFHHRLDQTAAVLVGCSTCPRKKTQNDFLILPINLCGGC
jgi:hypothetical protein